jgi:hypothetical protein
MAFRSYLEVGLRSRIAKGALGSAGDETNAV